MSQLEELLQQCTVKLTLPGRMGWGTGFFVAPGAILTCTHVVQEANGQSVQVRWQKRELEAVVERSLPDPYDLALLRVTLPTDANPTCVCLDEEVKSRDPLYLFGYPDQDFPNGCPVTFNCEGLTGDEPALIKFALGQVRPGMSGSPLLNQRTGKVCGMVKFTRDRSFDLGGGAVPTAVILAQFPDLVEQQRSFHQHDQRWLQWMMEGAIATDPVISPSTPVTLSLSAYDAATWVGRDALVTTLTQKLENGCRILVLTGITGIGKTALAERVVVEVSNIPFHRLNFDDRGQGRDFLSGALALLPKLGETVTTEDQKDPQNALNHLLRTLRSKRFLVQIDSLEMLLQGDEQTGWNAFTDSLWVDFFQQLLAGEDCQSQFLLTTQALSEELEMVGSNYPRRWHRQDVSGLSEAEQLELFEKNGLKLDDLGTETLKRIGTLYQGHPLVIQVIARDILDKPFNGNVQQYWQRYQAEFDEMERDKRKGSSPRSLQLRVKQRVEQSLKRLPSDAYQMLCRSSVYRRPVPEEFWLAMVAELLEDRQWTALELLKSRNLAEEELRNDGIIFLRQHNLVRSVARQLLQTNEAVWLDSEHTAIRVWLNDYKPEPNALYLEYVRGYLEAFDHYCEIGDWKSAGAILLTRLKILEGAEEELIYQLDTWGAFNEQIFRIKKVLGKLDTYKDSIFLNALGWSYHNTRDNDQAYEYHSQSLRSARLVNDYRLETNALHGIAKTYYSTGKYEKATDIYQQSLNLNKVNKDSRGEARALNGMGFNYLRLGKFEESIKCHQLSLELLEKFEERKVEADTLKNLGNAYRISKDINSAIKYYETCLEIARKIGDVENEVDALFGLGACFYEQGNYDKSIELLQKSLSVARRVGDLQGESYALGELGKILLKLEQYSEAQQHLQTSLEIFRNFKRLSDQTNESEVLLVLGELHYKTGEFNLAREYCDRALSIASKLGIPLVKECEDLQALLTASAPVGEPEREE